MNNNDIMKLQNIFKLGLTITLLVIYVFLMALESIDKYLKEETIFVETTETSNGLEAPSITFCRRGPDEV